MVHAFKSIATTTRLFWGIGTACLLFTSCSIPNLDKDLEQSQKVIDQNWVIPTLGHSQTTQVKRLTWEEAHQLMIEKNLNWIRSDQGLFRSKLAISHVYKDLIPVIDLSLSLSETFRNLDELEFEDLRLDGRGNFIIPGILQLSENLYSRKLAYLRSDIQRQVQYRKLFLSLRSLFERQRVLRDQLPLSRLLNTIKVDAANAIDLEDFDNLDEENRALHQEISQFFGMPYQEWELIGNAPDIQIAENNIDLTQQNAWGILQRKELAVDLAALAARIEGIKFDYWPDLTTSVSGATLFERSNGRTRYWDPGDTLLNLRLNYAFDFNQRIADNLKLARVDYLVAKQAIDAGLSEITFELSTAQEDLIEARREVDAVRLELQLIKELLAENALGANPETLRLLVNTLRESVETETRVGTIESTLIFFYEPYWKQYPTPEPIDFENYDYPKTFLEN